MTVKLYTVTGAKKTGTVKLLEAKLSDAGLSRVVRATLANDRRERPLAKTRGMVSGGGAKPWKQKGTGRARAGSNRSPIWRGGGVTFGPTGEPRAHRRIPQGMRRAAVLVVLAKLAEGDRLSVLSGKLSLAKSRDAAALFAKVVPEGSVLFLVTNEQLGDARGARNLAAVELTSADDCNVADLVRYDQVVMTEGAFERLTAGPKVPKKPVTKPGAKPSTKPAPKPRSAK